MQKPQTLCPYPSPHVICIPALDPEIPHSPSSNNISNYHLNNASSSVTSKPAAMCSLLVWVVPASECQLPSHCSNVPSFIQLHAQITRHQAAGEDAAAGWYIYTYVHAFHASNSLFFTIRLRPRVMTQLQSHPRRVLPAARAITSTPQHRCLLLFEPISSSFNSV